MPQKRDSRRDLRAEVTFLIEGRDPVVLPAAKYLVGIEVELAAIGSWHGEIELFDQDGDYLDVLLLNVGFLSQISFRFWEDGVGSAPYFHAGITTIDPDFRPEGVSLKIGVVNKDIHTATLQLKQRGWPAGTNPTDIVRAIAADRGWAVVDADQQSTIEQAASALDHPVQTTRESDIQFLIDRILPYSVDANGRHFEIRWGGQDKSVVYFRSSAALGAQKTRRSYTYLRDPNGEVISFRPVNNTLAGWLQGGGAGLMESVDSAEGAATTQKTTVTAGVDGVVPVQDALYVTPAPAAVVTTRVAVPGRSTPDTKAAASHIWSKFAEMQVSADLEVIGTHDLVPGEFADVNYFRKDNTPHPMSGTYRLLTIAHSFGLSGWNTTAKLVRNGQQATDGLSKLEAKTVINPQDAPSPDVASTSPVRAGSTSSRRAP